MTCQSLRLANCSEPTRVAAAWDSIPCHLCRSEHTRTASRSVQARSPCYEGSARFLAATQRIRAIGSQKPVRVAVAWASSPCCIYSYKRIRSVMKTARTRSPCYSDKLLGWPELVQSFDGCSFQYRSCLRDEPERHPGDSFCKMPTCRSPQCSPCPDTSHTTERFRDARHKDHRCDLLLVLRGLIAESTRTSLSRVPYRRTARRSPSCLWHPCKRPRQVSDFTQCD